jgi:hypothetical protein
MDQLNAFMRNEGWLLRPMTVDGQLFGLKGEEG